MHTRRSKPHSLGHSAAVQHICTAASNFAELISGDLWATPKHFVCVCVSCHQKEAVVIWTALRTVTTSCLRHYVGSTWPGPFKGASTELHGRLDLWHAITCHQMAKARGLLHAELEPKVYFNLMHVRHSGYAASYLLAKLQHANVSVLTFWAISGSYRHGLAVARPPFLGAKTDRTCSRDSSDHLSHSPCICKTLRGTASINIDAASHTNMGILRSKAAAAS